MCAYESVCLCACVPVSAQRQYLCLCLCMCVYVVIQPTADRLAQNLEIIFKNFQFSTRRTRIPMGCIISTMLLHGTNRKSHGQNSSALTKIKNNLKILCHPIINRLCILECKAETLAFGKKMYHNKKNVSPVFFEGGGEVLRLLFPPSLFPCVLFFLSVSVGVLLVCLIGL